MVSLVGCCQKRARVEWNGLFELFRREAGEVVVRGACITPTSSLVLPLSGRLYLAWLARRTLDGLRSAQCWR